MEQSQKLNFEYFFSLNLDLLCVVDLEGKFLKLNEAWCETFGYTMDELLNRSTFDFIHPDDLSSSLDATNNLVNTGDILLNYVNRFRDKNGEYHYIEWHCHPMPTYTYCTVRDITSYKLKEEETLREQNRLQAIVESQSKYLMRMDLNMNFTYANAKFIKDYNWFYDNPETLVGLPVFETDIVDYEDSMKHCIQQTIANPGTSFQYEECIPTVEGDSHYILWQCICFTDINGNPWEVQCSGLDITERKLLEILELEEQEQNLLYASTPISQLWDGILLLPVVGLLNTQRAQALMSSVLKKITETQSKMLILDISGVAVVDTAVANHFIKLSKATKLMGCTCTMCGISPAVAQTIVDLGIHIEEINTTGSMKDALEKALCSTGLELMELK